MNKKTLYLGLFVLALIITYIYICSIEVKGATEEDLYLVASVVEAESANQSELGKRLVADVIFNRLEAVEYPNTVSEVILQRGQFTGHRLAPNSSTLRLVEEELYSRTNSYVLWFRTKRYHKYGRPIVKEGDHYFSGR